MPQAASHAKIHAQLLPFLCGAYSDRADDARTGEYPEDKRGYHMGTEEFGESNDISSNDMMIRFEG